jgi:hypothetical protein
MASKLRACSTGTYVRLKGLGCYENAFQVVWAHVTAVFPLRQHLMNYDKLLNGVTWIIAQ